MRVKRIVAGLVFVLSSTLITHRTVAACVGDYCEAGYIEISGTCAVLCSLNGARGTLHQHICYECGRAYFERHVSCNC